MGNCLVTKLKGSVDNDNLSFFDCISLRYVQRENPTDASQWIRIGAAGGPVIVEALDGGTFSTTYGGESIGSTYTINADTNRDVYVSNHTGRIILRNKQNVSQITFSSGQLCKDFDYATRLKIISGVFDFSTKKTLQAIESVSLSLGSLGNLENISQRANLTYFDVGTPASEGTFSGSLESLSECRNLETLRVAKTGSLPALISFGGSILSVVNNPLHNISFDKNLSITGDFENLAQCLILYYNKYGNITNTKYAVSNTYIGGSVQAFVNACVDGGVTSGTIGVPYFKTATRIYSDIEHTLLIKDDANIAVANTNNILSWSSDKTWTVSNN